ncbi:MAG TPA: general secretion pathway protein GspB [Dokdonella sp.]
MSLILEALKKSEQQRRLGEAPTLGSPVQAIRRRRSLLPLFGALALIALGVGWWLSRSPAVAPAPTEAPQVAAAKPATPPADGRGTTPAAGKKPAPHFTTPAAPGAAVAAAGGPHTAAAAKPGDPAAQNALRNDRTAAAVPAPAAAPARPLAAPNETAPAAAKPAVASTNAPATAGVPQAPATPAPAPGAAAPAPNTAAPAASVAAAPSTANAAPPPHAAAPAAAQPALPSVWELPYATRKDIPELAITMHVYAGDPGQRFVVIKGERHVEGDDLGDGLTLKEIRADGMVLDYKGQRFVYPRDGR